MAVKHTFTSTIEDGADNTLVQPSDWNAEHVLSNALGAIDALTPAASKIPYFNGADSATLADITATGISLLGVADAAAGRTALGLGTIATQAADSVSLTGGSISGMTSIGGTLLSLASSSGAEHIFCKTNDTSNSNQSCIFVLRHYTSASEESATAFRLVSESGVNQLYLGGGALDHNACTIIKFFTASNYTTKYGTERGRLTNGGRWLFGTTTDDGASIAQVNGTIASKGIKLDGTASSDVNTLDYYKEGTFTVTGTGFTTSPTGTASYVRVGKQVTLSLPTISGTSNSTTFTLTGIPAEITISNPFMTVARVKDNSGPYVWGRAVIRENSTIELATDANGTPFTASGTKTMWIMHISYNLN